MLNSTKILLSSAAILLMSAVSASAQDITATIDITGSVAESCAVIDGQSTEDSFSDTINLGELADTDGTLGDGFGASTAGSPSGTSSFQVVCNTAAVDVTLEADSLENVAVAPTGYANLVHYTAQLDLDLADVTDETYTVASEAAPTATQETGTTAGALANAADNVTISFYGLATPAPTDLLVAGDYAGQIRVTIAPAI